jgi:hypothetical protein
MDVQLLVRITFSPSKFLLILRNDTTNTLILFQVNNLLRVFFKIFVNFSKFDNFNYKWLYPWWMFAKLNGIRIYRIVARKYFPSLFFFQPWNAVTLFRQLEWITANKNNSNISRSFGDFKRKTFYLYVISWNCLNFFIYAGVGWGIVILSFDKELVIVFWIFWWTGKNKDT